jgi:hypothetical protein
MSSPARAPRIGIDGKTNAAGVRVLDAANHAIDGEAGSLTKGIFVAESPVDGVGVSTPIRPGRSRSRSKDVPEGKIKGTPSDARNKPPPTRRTPSRGRYVDEYAHPPATEAHRSPVPVLLPV